MKNIIFFETAKELVDAFIRFDLPETVTLGYSRASGWSFEGEGSEKFQIAEGVSIDDLIFEMADRLHVRLDLA